MPLVPPEGLLGGEKTGDGFMEYGVWGRPISYRTRSRSETPSVIDYQSHSFLKSEGKADPNFQADCRLLMTMETTDIY